MTVPETAPGTYWLRVSPENAAQSPLTFVASRPRHGELRVDGPTVAVASGRPCQEVQLALRDLVPWERFTLHVDTGEDREHLMVHVLYPDGRVEQSWQMQGFGQDQATLLLPPSPDGPFVLRFIGPGESTGPYTLTASTPLRGAVTVDGGPVTIAETRPGQEVVLDLGTVPGGQVLDVRVAREPDPGHLELTLLSPKGHPVHTWEGWDPEISETLTVPVLGAYSLRLVPRDGARPPYTVEVATRSEG
jgi:hypothetical protein